MSVEIQRNHPSDAADTRALWEEIFTEDSAAFLDYYYSVKTKDNQLQTIRTDGVLTAMIHWNPYPIRICGSEADSCYLVAVATKKEYRHRGQMASLLKAGLRDCAKAQIPLVWLMPADPAIYEPFDFRYIYEKCEGKWPQSEVSVQASGGCSRQEVFPDSFRNSLEIRPLHPEEYAEAAAFLNRELERRYQVYTKRTPEYLAVTEAETQTEDGHAAGIFSFGALVGVFSYWVEDTIILRELVTTPEYESGEDRADLTAAVRSFFRAIPGLPEEITAITTGWLGERKPIIMARPANLEALMTRMKAKRPRTLCVRVDDPILPENNGCFLWQTGSAGSSWQLAPADAVPDLSFTIAELTQWLFREQREEFPELCPLRSFFNEIV